MFHRLLSSPKRRILQLAGLLLTATMLRPAFALGIDKLSLDIDANGKFSSSSQVVLFNDTNDVVFVTGRPLAWSSDDAGSLTTSPTTELVISPAMARIPAQGSATFSIRYIGPKKETEATFRAAFRETRMPGLEGGGDTGGVGAQVLAGIVVTIPVFVSDYAAKIPAFKDVEASFRRNGQEAMLTVNNGGGRHVIVDSVRIGDQEVRRPHDTLFAKRQKTYTGIKAPAPGDKLTLVLTNGTDTQRIDAAEAK
ncbi:P pilus assembly chaperone PapD [Variovorax boronicumulans]|uniref:hypothetical protein n=1 Tax=Variovorax boronicumulans TaxID=436515 RepID=UPI00278B1898|nr:hypothetical protein [Variovorax boronicumulans]MDQ0012194.1 P pilus assembly chaperone PapD [Variovorax boronicumulans]